MNDWMQGCVELLVTVELIIGQGYGWRKLDVGVGSGIDGRMDGWKWDRGVDGQMGRQLNGGKSERMNVGIGARLNKEMGKGIDGRMSRQMGGQFKGWIGGDVGGQLGACMTKGWMV